MNKKIIYAIDLILVVGTLFAFIGIFGYTRPLVISPINDLKTTNDSVLFSFEKGDFILIDDNIEFSSPEKINVKDNLVINLKPGKYYWKVEGLFGSEVRTLTIVSQVDLKLKDAGENYEVINSGNTKLNVDVYDEQRLVGNLILEPEESKNSSGTLFLGRENEK